MNFKIFAENLEKLNSTSKRLEKTNIIAKLLAKTKEKDIESVLLLLEGRVFPIWSNNKLGLAGQLAIKAISKSFGIKTNQIENYLKEKGDLGLCAEHFCTGKKQQTLFGAEELEINKVFFNLKKLAEIEGKGTVDIKIGLIAELLNNATAVEAKYIIRIAIGDLRIGVAFGTIRDAIALQIFPENDKKEVVQILQEAFDKLNETYKVVQIAKKEGIKGLQKVGIKIMNPLRVMLAQKVNNFSEAVKKIELPCACEIKYDGFRAEIHKKENKVNIFTRNLEEVSAQFPDIVKYIKSQVKAKEIILDGEILAVDKNNGMYLPFQNISQRIKRKYDIKELAEKFPAVYVTWDIIYLEGKSTLKVPMKERRKLLLESIETSLELNVSEQVVVNTIEDGTKFYDKTIKDGHEGIIVKDLNADYKPGNRVGCWIKIKPTMDPLSLVIVGAEWGEGKRANWLTSFTIACQNYEGKFLTIGKVGTGIKEIEQEGGTTFKELTNLLKPLIFSNKGKEIKVRPKIIIEIAYEEIQKSPTYTSGFALRFPRFIRIRSDEIGIEDVDSIKKVKQYFDEQ